MSIRAQLPDDVMGEANTLEQTKVMTASMLFKGYGSASLAGGLVVLNVVAIAAIVSVYLRRRADKKSLAPTGYDTI